VKSLVFSLLLLSAPAKAATVTIGGTSFALGEDAFPTGSACIDASGCPGDVILANSSFQPVPREDALLGHDLSLVVIDMDETNVFRLTFSQPIVNRPGNDLYLAQAEFTGDPDRQDGIHAVQIRFDNSATWYTLGIDQFSRDAQAGVPIVSFLDPEPKQAGYFLWFTTQDLTDFGFAAGASITAFDLRGLAGAGSGLDAAVAGNLNLPEPGIDVLLETGMLGLVALARIRRRSRA
jgi:hypothetical protein